MSSYEPSRRLKAKRERRPTPSTTCAEPGCGKPSYGYYHCTEHYAALCEFSREDERPATDDRWRKGGG